MRNSCNWVREIEISTAWEKPQFAASFFFMQYTDRPTWSIVMKSPIIVVLGTKEPDVISAVARATQAYRQRAPTELNVNFTSMPTASERLRGIEPLLKEACLRAQTIRHTKAAAIGIAKASGAIELGYNRGARRALFEAHVIVAAVKGSVLICSLPNGCPEAASSALDEAFQRAIRRYQKDDIPVDTATSTIAELAVRTWAEIDNVFPDPEIKLMC